MKKKLALILLIIVCALCCAFSLGACNNTPDNGNDSDEDEEITVGLEFTLLENDTYEVTTYKGQAVKVIIPSTYEGKPVASIRDNAFCVNSIIENVIVGDEVTSIGEYAFYRCDFLRSITLPTGLKTIGESAFGDCNNLKSVYYKGNVADWCGISFETYSSNPLNCAHNLYMGGELVTELIIPDGITQIGKYAFYGCTPITSITLPVSLTASYYDSFASCTSLTGVYYKGDLTGWCNVSFETASSNPLSYAHNLYMGGELVTELVIPDGITQIGERVFYGCSSLKSLTIPEGITSIGAGAFHSCTLLTNLIIPNSVTSIGEYAFTACESLMSLTLGSGVTSIGYFAFNGCYKLVEIYNLSSMSLKKGATGSYTAYYALDIYTSLDAERHLMISDNGFIFRDDGQTALLIDYTGKQTELTLPEKFNGKSYGIHNYAFRKRTDITSVIIPDGVTSIGTSSFLNCTSLASITMPNSITSIGDYAFSGCTALESLTLPSGLKTIGAYAFENCSLFSSLVIPNSVTSIGKNSFYGCSGLISVTIGKSVKSIESGAFVYCNKIVEVYNLSSLSIVKDTTNYGYLSYYALDIYTSSSAKSKLTTTEDGFVFHVNGQTVKLVGYTGKEKDITLPEKFNGKSYGINKYAFYGCTTVTSLTVPDAVTSIGDGAFKEFNSLESLTLRYISKESDDSVFSESWFGDIFGAGVSHKAGFPQSLKTVVITSGTKLDKGAFYNCSSLESITLPDTLTSIGKEAFRSCISLKSIVIPDNVRSIDNYAFMHCVSLESITLPRITQIGQYAFSGCASFTNITLPDSLGAISNNAFDGCSSLKSITFNGTKEQWYKIRKDYEWNHDTGNYTVHCTDGDIEK